MCRQLPFQQWLNSACWLAQPKPIRAHDSRPIRADDKSLGSVGLLHVCQARRQRAKGAAAAAAAAGCLAASCLLALAAGRAQSTVDRRRLASAVGVAIATRLAFQLLVRPRALAAATAASRTPRTRRSLSTGQMVLLGNTLEVPDGLGLGCMSVSGQYDNGVPLPEEQATAFFRGCYEAGCRHFDTAEAYRSKPELGVFNEGQLGAFFATVPRDSFTVGTKFHPGFHGGASDYATIRGALLASLQRLGLEYVDLYYAHRTPSTSFAVEFTTHAARLREVHSRQPRACSHGHPAAAAAIAAASDVGRRLDAQEGLLRNIGLSECAPVDLRAACAVAPICAVQQEWSLLTRNAEEELIPVCKELGVVSDRVAPSPRRGVLAGEHTIITTTTTTTTTNGARRFGGHWWHRWRRAQS
jgi:aryl-alcohol dehydrogenase-like predicted oxidoreductase